MLSRRTRLLGGSSEALSDDDGWIVEQRLGLVDLSRVHWRRNLSSTVRLTALYVLGEGELCMSHGQR